jgi:hypothetical protein
MDNLGIIHNCKEIADIVSRQLSRRITGRKNKAPKERCFFLSG